MFVSFQEIWLGDLGSGKNLSWIRIKRSTKHRIPDLQHWHGHYRSPIFLENYKKYLTLYLIAITPWFLPGFWQWGNVSASSASHAIYNKHKKVEKINFDKKNLKYAAKDGANKKGEGYIPPVAMEKLQWQGERTGVATSCSKWSSQGQWQWEGRGVPNYLLQPRTVPLRRERGTYLLQPMEQPRTVTMRRERGP